MATFKTSVEKAKAKAAEEAAKAENRFQRTARTFWKPKQGQNRIRILPAWTGEGPNANQFWREMYVHWGIGPDEENQVNLTCPRLTPGSETKECPVCDEYNRLRGTKDPNDLEMAKELRAKQRAYSNIIDLTDPTWSQEDLDEFKLQGVEEIPGVDSPKIQVFNYGPTILKELLDIFCDEIDLTDLTEGHNVVITRTGKDLQTQYRVRIETKSTPAPVDSEPDLHDLDAIMPFKEPYVMKALLEGVDPEEMKKLYLAEGKIIEGGNGESKPAAKAASKPAAKAVAKKPAPKPEPVEEEAVEEEEVAEEEVAEEEEAVEEEAVEEEAVAEEEGEGPPPCFGAELDAGDTQCSEDCGLFEDCKVVTEARLAKEKRKPVGKPASKPAPVAAKPAGKPAAPVAGKKPASPATGKAAGKMDTGDVDDLAKRMRAAIDGNR